MANPLRQLEALGQSIWMDYVSRGALKSGQLKRWIDEDGVSGVTSNPSIFEKAIVGTHDYDDEINRLLGQGKKPADIYEAVTVEDIRNAADLFRPLYDRTHGGDGFVSLEVSPDLAHDTQASINEARKLWKLVDRPNLMVKIPGTREGLPAIRQCLSEGININITLLFGLPRYQEVVDAYFGALEDRVKQKLPIADISSVASFFLSRIDVLLDPTFEKLMSGNDAKKADLAKKLHGQVAIASAKVASEIFQQRFNDQRFKALEAMGAKRQRLLWASTSTKNPAYSDVKYVEALIGPETIDTVPVETLDDFRDHGNAALTLSKDHDQAHAVLDDLQKLGIDINQVTQQLEDEGVEKFKKAFKELMDNLSEKVKA